MVPEIRDAIRALKAYKDTIYWFPKKEEAEGRILEMMSGLEAILQMAIKASRKLPSDRLFLSEGTITDTSEYHFSVFHVHKSYQVCRALWKVTGSTHETNQSSSSS